MPLNTKGKEIMSNMKQEYGKEKGKEVFYASRNKGTIKNVDPESTKKASVAFLQGFIGKLQDLTK